MRLAAQVAAPPPAERFADADLARILAELGEREQPTGTFFRSPASCRIFFDGGRFLDVDLPTGRVSGEVAPRAASRSPSSTPCT